MKKQAPVAIRLAVAIKHLRARMRDIASAGLPIAQLAIIQRLRSSGPTTAAALAIAEHVSQQAIAQNLMELKRANLVTTTLDPTDARKSLISVTTTGQQLFEAAFASRNAWLTQAIDSTIAPEEQAHLEKAIELLERLANTENKNI